MVELTGAILNLDGSECFRGKLQAPLEEAEALGRRLAEKLKAEGADAVLQKIYAEQRTRTKE
jgi:hydroxymethylbilane synthase